MGERKLSLAVSQQAVEDADGSEFGAPLFYAFAAAERGKPLEKDDEALAVAPATLSKRVARVMAARLTAPNVSGVELGFRGKEFPHPHKLVRRHPFPGDPIEDRIRMNP